ncbi:MAG: hypothetical protein V1874_01170 [Spirochaetota bacterium]
MYKKIFLFFIVCSLSCTTINVSKYQDLNEQLRAENSLMKNRLALLQRENSVLKEENLQTKKEVQQLNAKIEKLASDMHSSKDKYQKDITLRESQYKNLEMKAEKMGKESAAKIHELATLNKNIETKLTFEIKQLNNAIKIQQDAFSKEREILRNENLQKELALSRQIEELKKIMLEKESDIASLKIGNSELSVKIHESGKSLADKEKAMQVLEKEYTNLKEKIKSAESAPDKTNNAP